MVRWSSYCYLARIEDVTDVNAKKCGPGSAGGKRSSLYCGKRSILDCGVSEFHSFFSDIFAFEGGNYTLSRNVGNRSPTHAAKHSRVSKTSVVLRGLASFTVSCVVQLYKKLLRRAGIMTAFFIR